MRKYLLFIATTILSISLFSCSSDDPPKKGGGEDEQEKLELKNGRGVYSVDEEDNTLIFCQVDLADMSFSSAGDYNGPGNVLSLTFVFDQSHTVDALPAGQYALSSQSMAGKILKTNSYYVSVNEFDSQRKSQLTDLEMNVKKSGSGYVIEGKYGIGENSNTFTFDGTIDFEHSSLKGIYNRAEVLYRSDFHKTQCNNYVISLGDMLGNDLKLELSAPKTDRYYTISEGEYLFSGSNKTRFIIVNSENSIFGPDDDASRITEGQITLESDGDIYTMIGTLTLENSSTVPVRYTGSLPINKLYITNLELFLSCFGNTEPYGTPYLAQLHNGINIDFSHFRGPCEELCVSIIAEDPLFWEKGWTYLDVPEAEYTYYDDEEFVANTLWCNEKYSEFGLWFHDSNAEAYEYFRFIDGSSNWKSTPSGFSYGYEISGTILAVLADADSKEIIDPERIIEITFDFSGNAAEYIPWHDCRPISNLENDVNLTNIAKAAFEDDDLWAQGYWEYGAEGISKQVVLYMGTEDMDFGWWTGPSASDYLIILSLNVPIGWERGVVPTGTFKPNHFWPYDPYTFNMGHERGIGNLFHGSVYLTSEFVRVGTFMDGEITITPSDDDYIIEFSFIDDQGNRQRRISGEYTGPVQYGGITRSSFDSPSLPEISASKSNPVEEIKRYNKGLPNQ